MSEIQAFAEQNVREIIGSKDKQRRKCEII
jgi:hypothetical protein